MGLLGAEEIFTVIKHSSICFWQLSKKSFSNECLIFSIIYYLLISKEHILKSAQQLAATLQTERKLPRKWKNSGRCWQGKVKISASRNSSNTVHRETNLFHIVWNSFCVVLFLMAPTKQFSILIVLLLCLALVEAIPQKHLEFGLHMQARKSSANTTWLRGTVLPPYVFEWQHSIMFFCVSCDQLHVQISMILTHCFWISFESTVICLAVLKVSLRDAEGTDFKDHVYYQDKKFCMRFLPSEMCCLVWAGRQKMQKTWSEAKELRRQTWQPRFLQGRSYTLHQSGMKCNGVWYKMFLN